MTQHDTPPDSTDTGTSQSMSIEEGNTLITTMLIIPTVSISGAIALIVFADQSIQSFLVLFPAFVALTLAATLIWRTHKWFSNQIDATFDTLFENADE